MKYEFLFENMTVEAENRDEALRKIRDADIQIYDIIKKEEDN